MAWEDASVVIKMGDKTLPRQYLNALGRELVQIILKRTADGKDKNGNAFVPYSDEYKKSDDFRLTGKSPSRVNMRLSGDMLADLGILSARDGRIVIGFEREEQRAKAHGHITGKDGTGKLPVRDFLGISKSELEQAMRKVPPPRKLKEAFDLSKEILLRNTEDSSFNLQDVIEFVELMALEAEIL